MAMSQFSAEIRRQGKWWLRFQEENFRDEWIAYALDRPWNIQTPSSSLEKKLTSKQVLYLLYVCLLVLTNIYG
jgi:hypothetical protein